MLPGVHIHFLMNPYIQLAFTLPVFIIGMSYFGKSAWYSITQGIPNMNVLVAIGALASFGYSLYGTLIGQGALFAYYETTATIITLVFFGNYLEDASVQSTQRALKDLVKAQKVMANMIVFDENHKEIIFNVESMSLKVGDIILVNVGETIPMDSKILWGEASVNESIVTGESVPVFRKMHDILLGGSTIENGTIKAYVTAVGDDTVLANILKMVKAAQGEKPPVQILADKISAIFVPLVLGIALLTLIGNLIITDIGFGASMLRAIAVLVISCPCAMGLATPAQGQEITSTAMALSILAPKPISVIIKLPISVSSAIPKTKGTKMALILSAKICTGGFSPWAAFTIFKILASTVSSPTAVT